MELAEKILTASVSECTILLYLPVASHLKNPNIHPDRRTQDETLLYWNNFLDCDHRMFWFGIQRICGRQSCRKYQKKILVNIENQTLIAVQANKRVFEYDVVTGRPNKETHPGKFAITRKIKDYTSKTYGSPMPYSMFFTKDGKAIHGTQWAAVRSYLHAYITESVGSQGCVSLSEEDARELFNWAPVGTPIVILEGREHEEERLDAYKRR